MATSHNSTSSRDEVVGSACHPAMLAARLARSTRAAADASPKLPPKGGKVVVSWSGGKDSAMALHRLQSDSTVEVVGLLTTISRRYRRISHHGVREELLDVQAEALGLPLHKMYYGSQTEEPESDSMAEFEQAMEEQLADLRQTDVFHIAYGDIFLADLRNYREQRLATVGMRGLFPLWRPDGNTTALLRQFTDDGFRAVVTCAEPSAAQLAGVDLCADLLANNWPDGVDPCGEHGEFHTFVYDGPIFDCPVPFARGETVIRGQRHYTDLIATSPTAEAHHD